MSCTFHALLCSPVLMNWPKMTIFWFKKLQGCTLAVPSCPQHLSLALGFVSLASWCVHSIRFSSIFLRVQPWICKIISSLTQTSLSNTVIDNPQTKAPDEQILQILEYLNSDTVWYVSSVLHFFKLHCVWSVDVRKLLSLIWLVNKVLMLLAIWLS